MTTTTTIRSWEAAATDRANNVATSILSPMNNARLRNLFGSVDVADAVEFYAEDTDEELFTFAKEGDDLAAWALLIRSLPQSEMFTRRNGSLNSVIDEDDVAQMIAEAFLDRLAVEETYELFRSRFLSDSRHTANEAQRFSTDVTAPPLELAAVRNALKACEGDFVAAFELYQSRSDAAHRMSEDRFYSLAALATPGSMIRLDAQDSTGNRSVSETLADLSSEGDFLAVLGEGFDSDDIEAAWDSLTDKQREIMTRRLGLFDGNAETATSIAADLGISQPAVTQAFKSATKKLATKLSRRNATQAAPVEPKPARPAKAPAPVRASEVEVRTVTDETPARQYPRTNLPKRPAHTPDLTKNTAPLEGNGAWSGYHRPVTERPVPNSFVPTSEIYFEPHWDRKTAERLAPAKARKAAAKAQESEEILRFARTLRQN